MADPFLDQIMGSAVWEGSGKTRGSPLWQFSLGFSIFHLLYPENVSLFNCHALGKELAVIICLFLCFWNRPSAWYLLALVPQIFGRKEKLPAAMTKGAFEGLLDETATTLSTYTYSPLVCDWLALKGECQLFLFGLKCLPRGEVKSNQGVVGSYIQITLSKLALAS